MYLGHFEPLTDFQVTGLSSFHRMNPAYCSNISSHYSEIIILVDVISYKNDIMSELTFIIFWNQVILGSDIKLSTQV